MYSVNELNRKETQSKMKSTFSTSSCNTLTKNHCHISKKKSTKVTDQNNGTKIYNTKKNGNISSKDYEETGTKQFLRSTPKLDQVRKTRCHSSTLHNSNSICSYQRKKWSNTSTQCSTDIDLLPECEGGFGRKEKNNYFKEEQRPRKKHVRLLNLLQKQEQRDEQVPDEDPYVKEVSRKPKSEIKKSFEFTEKNDVDVLLTQRDLSTYKKTKRKKYNGKCILQLKSTYWVEEAEYGETPNNFTPRTRGQSSSRCGGNNIFFNAMCRFNKLDDSVQKEKDASQFASDEVTVKNKGTDNEATSVNKKQYFVNEMNVNDILFNNQNNGSCLKKKKLNSKTIHNYYFQNYSSHNLIRTISPLNVLMHKEFIDACNLSKQLLIEKLLCHMKYMHNYDSLKLLQSYWDKNEYSLIYKYEKMVANVEKYVPCKKKKPAIKVFDRCTRRKRYIAENDSCSKLEEGIREKKEIEEEKKKVKKYMLQFLHKRLTKSVSKKMMFFILGKLKYHTCIAIINILLKNIPLYAYLGRRLKILKELFGAYEQKFHIKNKEDLKKANEEIDRDIKKGLNTICDLIINFFINDINTLKRIMEEIADFLKNMGILKKMETYLDYKKIQKKKSLHMLIFVEKINYLLEYLEDYIHLKSKHVTNSLDARSRTNSVMRDGVQKHAYEEHNRNNTNDKSNNFFFLDDRIVTPRKSNFKEESCVYDLNVTPVKMEEHNNMSCTPLKSVTPVHISTTPKNGHLIENKTSIKKDENVYSLSVTPPKVAKRQNLPKKRGYDLLTQSREQCYDNSSCYPTSHLFRCHESVLKTPLRFNYNNYKSEKENKKNTYLNLSTNKEDLLFLEYILIYFCELFYYLLTPCIFLLPLSNECIAHVHGSGFFEIFNNNLQKKLLNVLHYNKLHVEELVSPLSSVKVFAEDNICKEDKSYKWQLKNQTNRDVENMKSGVGKDKANNSKLEKDDNNNSDSINLEEEVISFFKKENITKIENMAILFKIIETAKTRVLNCYNLFNHYVNIKLDTTYECTQEKVTQKEWNDEETQDKVGNILNKRRSICQNKKEGSSQSLTAKNHIKSELMWGHTLYYESFQELFLQFLISIMSLFYCIKIVYIPTFFAKGKNDLENEAHFVQKNLHLKNSKENLDQVTENENSVLKTNKKEDNEEDSQKIKYGNKPQQETNSEPSNDNTCNTDFTSDYDKTNGEVKSGQAYVINKNDNPYVYINYIMEKLSHINIKKIIFGKSYLP